MYLAGIALLSLGIVQLVFVPIAIASSRGEELFWFFVYTLFVTVPMIVGGVALIRRVEGRGKGRSDVVEGVEAGHVVESRTEGMVGAFRGFDLGRLNWVGWLLFLVSLGLVVGGGVALAQSRPDLLGRGTSRLPAGILLVLSVGFFLGMRWLLGSLGISIYRGESRDDESGASTRIRALDDRDPRLDR